MSELKISVIFVIGFLFLFLTGWFTYSYFDANAYNEITGKNVTTGQAMFLQLRVFNEQK